MITLSVLIMGCIVLVKGYGHYIPLVVLPVAFILPIIGHKFHGVKND